MKMLSLPKIAAIVISATSLTVFLYRGTAQTTAANAPAATVTTQSGGSITTPLTGGFAVDKNSSLIREWITVHQSQLPVDLVGTAGIATSYGSDKYFYEAAATLKVTEPITAVELRFIIFDLWGAHMETLIETRIEDMPVGQTDTHRRWNVPSEGDCARCYASIAYVARVRTASGRVIEANPETIVDAARKFSAKFKAEDLDASAPKR